MILKWDTRSDLDIQVQCGCGIWHGFGTDGGSKGICKCEECEMYRDKDSNGAEDIITDEGAYESSITHVIFANPRKLIGKTIGMACLTTEHTHPEVFEN